MIYLQLFLTFLEIGAVSFGGGYGMLPLIREKCLVNGWLTEEGVMNFIAVSESTPGPISVNMATFIGSSQGGFGGSAVATLGLVLPSFVIILLIAAVMKNFIRYKGVQAVLGGIKPVVVGLILGTSATMFLSTILGVTSYNSGFSLNPQGIVILGIIVAVAYGYQKWKKEKISPILLIVISAVLGMIFYS